MLRERGTLSEPCEDVVCNGHTDCVATSLVHYMLKLSVLVLQILCYFSIFSLLNEQRKLNIAYSGK